MFTIRSLRQQGALVDVILKGVPTTISILKMGLGYSDQMTQDMRTQQAMGFIDFVPKLQAPTKVQPAKEAVVEVAKEEPVVSEVVPPEAPSEPPVVRDPAFYSEEELASMRKNVLLALAEKHQIQVDTTASRAVLASALVAVGIPKE